jgi:hypothetical protein
LDNHTQRVAHDCETRYFTMEKNMRLFIAVAASSTCGTFVQAEVVKYTNKAEWQSLVNSFTTIKFTEVPHPALITNQYSYLGVTFTEANDVLLEENAFINDGFGLYGNLPGNAITMVFASPITSFAIDHPGTEGFKLYMGSEFIFDTGLMGGSGTGKFSGIISTLPFDKVVIQDPIAATLIDDMYFGPPIPAPGTLALLAIAALNLRKRGR